MPPMTPYAMLYTRCQFSSVYRSTRMNCVLVRERDENDGENRRHGVSDIVPINIPYIPDH